MRPKKAKRFECECGSQFETEEEANDCCDSESPEEVYRCPHCGNVYDEVYEAEECCKDERVSIVAGYECGECGSFYEDREDAKECCK